MSTYRVCEFGKYYPPRCRKRATVTVRYSYSSGHPEDVSRATVRCDDHCGANHFKGCRIESKEEA